MNVLVACEFSGTVRDAFTRRGHTAVSCDLLPSDAPGLHHQGDVRQILNLGWDLIIAHPDCTFLTLAGNKWFKPEFADRFPTRHEDREQAVAFFMEMVNADCPRICVENPVGVMSSRYRKPTQYIQPFEYGHPETKKTGLWLKGLPPLIPTNVVEPEFVICKGKKYSPTHYAHKGGVKDGWKVRARTYQGIADAMARQWA